MRIGILVTGHVHDSLVGTFGDYSSMFTRLLDGHGFTFQSWNVVDLEFPADVTQADGWLLTGSRYGAYEDAPFIAPLEAFIREAYAKAVPMVGICFGHQVIAQALGGKVEKFAKGWAVGAEAYDFEGETLNLNAWHQDQVVVLPADAKVIARNDFCENAALLYGDRAFTVQAHPEIQHDYLEGLIEKRGPGIVPEPVLQSAQKRLETKLDDQIIADRIAAFFKQPRA
ncbi:MAG: GMP synthase-like glutamine amidotransferase [Pseudorhodobacter sp.]|jgi:GMP synthase-like glutamine amidotransferase